MRIDVRKQRAVGFWDAPVLTGSELALSPSGKQAYLARDQGGVIVVDTAAGGSDPGEGVNILREVPLQAKLHAMHLLREGASLALVDRLKNELWILDTETWEVQQRLKTGKGPCDIALSRDGKTLVVANRSGPSISLYRIP